MLLRSLSLSFFVATVLGCGAAGDGSSAANQPLPTPPPGIEITGALPTVYFNNPSASGVGPRDFSVGGGGGNIDYIWDHHFWLMNGRAGNYVDSIQFRSDTGYSQFFGGRGGIWYSIPCNDSSTPDYYQVGLLGHAGDFVDELVPYCGTDTIMGEERGGAGGGSHGGNFYSHRCAMGTHIIGWAVGHGDFVDSLTGYCGR